MADSINDPIAEQIARANAQTEMARARMLDEMYRTRALMDAQTSTSRGFMDRVQGFAAGTARATMGAARYAGGMAIGAAGHAVPYIVMGGGYAGSYGPGVGRSIMQAFGMGGDAFDYGPAMAGHMGSYYAGAQSFGGLLYESGLGAALRDTIGMGMFFRDVNQRFGVAPGIIRERSQEELGLRFETVGNRFLSSLPFASRMGTRFYGMEEDIQRSLAQRLSFMNTRGMAGSRSTGRGFRATSDIVERLADRQTEALSLINRQLGYNLSDADAQAALDTGLATFGDFEISSSLRGGRDNFSGKLRDATQGVHRAASELRVSTQDLRQFRESMRRYGDSALTLAMEADAARDIKSGRFIGSTQSVIRARDQYAREAFAMGIDDQAGTRAYADLASRRSVSLYEAARDGVMKRSTLGMYGGEDEAAQARNFRQRVTQVGLGVMQDPATRALVYQNPEYIQQVLRGGGGGVMGRYRALAGATLSNPFGATLAQYDARTYAAAAQSGLLLQFRQAQEDVDFMRPIYRQFMSDTEMRGMETHGLVERTGMEPFEAVRQAEFIRGLDTRMGSRAGGGLYYRAMQAATGVTERRVRGLMGRAAAMGIDPSSLTDRQIRRYMDNAAGGSARRDFLRAGDWEKGRRGGGLMDRWLHPGGYESSELQKRFDALIAGGFSVEDINAELRMSVVNGQSAGEHFRLSDSGHLQVWSKGRFQDYEQVSWADKRIGDDRWTTNTAEGMRLVVNDLGKRMRDPLPIRDSAAMEELYAGSGKGTEEERLSRILSGSQDITLNRLSVALQQAFGTDNAVSADETLKEFGLSGGTQILREYYRQKGFTTDGELSDKLEGVRTPEDFNKRIQEIVAGGDQALLNKLNTEMLVRRESDANRSVDRMRHDGSHETRPLYVKQVNNP